MAHSINIANRRGPSYVNIATITPLEAGDLLQLPHKLPDKTSLLLRPGNYSSNVITGYFDLDNDIREVTREMSNDTNEIGEIPISKITCTRNIVVDIVAGYHPSDTEKTVNIQSLNLPCTAVCHVGQYGSLSLFELHLNLDSNNYQEMCSHVLVIGGELKIQKCVFSFKSAPSSYVSCVRATQNASLYIKDCEFRPFQKSQKSHGNTMGIRLNTGSRAHVCESRFIGLYCGIFLYEKTKAYIEHSIFLSQRTVDVCVYPGSYGVSLVSCQFGTLENSGLRETMCGLLLENNAHAYLHSGKNRIKDCQFDLSSRGIIVENINTRLKITDCRIASGVVCLDTRFGCRVHAMNCVLGANTGIIICGSYTDGEIVLRNVEIIAPIQVLLGAGDKPPIMVDINHEVKQYNASEQARNMRRRQKILKHDKYKPHETPGTPLMEIQKIVRVCGCCLLTQNLAGHKFKLCLGCETIYYCSKECQARHWKQHKTQCREIKHLLKETSK